MSLPEDKFPVVFIAQSNGLAQSMERLAQREQRARSPIAESFA
jgi:hypothetical protein